MWSGACSWDQTTSPKQFWGCSEEPRVGGASGLRGISRCPFSCLSGNFTRACLRPAESIQVHPLPQSIQVRNISPPSYSQASALGVPRAPHYRRAPRTLQAPLLCASEGRSSLCRRGVATLARPLASTSGIATGWPGRSQGQHQALGRMLGVPGVPRRTRLRESPMNRSLGMRDSAANSGEPLPCLGPLARVAPHLIFPGSWASRPQARPTAHFGLMPPPTFVWTPRRSKCAWGQISSSERGRLSTTCFSVSALPMSVSRGSSAAACP